MDFHTISLDQRIAENIKGYEPEHLYPVALIKDFLCGLAEYTKADILLTDRHGKKIVLTEGYRSYEPDVNADPGMKIRVADRTIAHLYLNFTGVDEDKRAQIEKLFLQMVDWMALYGRESYLHKELDLYSDDLEQLLEKEKIRATHDNKEDVLTGVLNRSYFINRRQVIDRSEVIPVAELCVNINDWKYVYDHFGNEESDRLIRVVADIVKQYAKPDYVIGRTDGDVFTVLIPMPEDGEAEEYVKQIQSACLNYEDPVIAPSVACGIAVKNNVEQNLEELYSDAEYEMFDNKFQIKNAPGYRERLEKKN